MGIVDAHLSQLLSGDASADSGLMAIFDDLHVGIALFDLDCRYRYLNRTAQQATLQDQPPIGRSIRDLVTAAYGPEQAERTCEIFERVLATGEPYHQKAWSLAERRLEPRPAYYDWSIYRVRDGQRVAGLLLTLSDVTEHIRIQHALLSQQRLLRTVVDAVPGLLAYVDRERRYVFANQAYRKLVGRDPEQITGLRIDEVLGPVAYQRLRPMIEGALGGETTSYVMPLELPGQPVRHLYGQYIPVKNPQEEVIGFIGLVQDVTERHEMEQRLKRQNQELEQFAGLAAHDLQAPLRQASLQAELLGMRLESRLDQDERVSLDHLRDGVGRMQALVRALLSYARSGASVSFSEIDLQAAAAAALDNLAGEIERLGAKVELDPLPVVQGEISLLTQVFQNLLSNGIKFCESTPILRIEHRERADAHEIRVSDNGIGMPPEQLEQAFQSFRRLHGGDYAGTGLGLASCRKIVEAHGGRIWAECNPEGGCTFAFTLPRA